jgi:hypothetical protein
MDYFNPSDTSQTALESNRINEPNRYEKYETERELAKAIKGSKEILVEATTIFPFTFFPDNITVDRTQVTIVHRSFFKVGEVTSIRIEDILNADAIVGPFFGSLRLYTRIYNTPQHPYTIKWLWRNDALRIKRILHGYLIAIKKNIDCSALSTYELATMLDNLGQGSGSAHDEA